ncbi:UDP-N-acetylmuramoyl-L-alanyl-D-glutamate--2,6-diaminopimelate ligase [Maribrevibacterium harenarium]|uniref:UDP-N-acetylmuramoyl-L-alanyl-D-glutamate--2,6-diaminopimelate ligase n=1 Tax=Maribrevibacterium harenarium TaxID=2589817 RepID=A0A501WY94_9GAMM|nr:UDP-N-acetylmuramoyl-L-alanyl-D-glutamate--2,6-diaminopimelate ligase [Maribrevibacterium harenarium]TPE51981.1 UDP-N-acetylmuramoyl-L-alanyl-D-glutamate--2,6-diaminopimelate ligase [Maribrevibacterium harenarium]
MTILTKALLDALNISQNYPELASEYRSFVTDSRRSGPDTIFVALAGVSANGWDYLEQVAANGCSLVLLPQEIEVSIPKGVVALRVEDIRNRVAGLIRMFYGPAPKHIVAVTGTNGKSSTCFYLAQLAQACGLRSAMIGTFGLGPLDQLQAATHTTPDFLSLHQYLSEFGQQGVELVAFEASSHALDQGRLEGVEVATGIFTNLTRDHLDYHGSMEAYGAAKQKLFSMPNIELGVGCVDDEHCEFMLSPLRGSQTCTVGFAADADLQITNVTPHPSGFQVAFVKDGESYDVALPLLGRFNVINAMLALAALWPLVSEPQQLLQHVSKLKGAPGRMQVVTRANAPLVVVDYAHTPDALQVALAAVREHVQGRLICIFGCGGDRDRGKRTLMMAAALAGADRVVLTSDNPRTEDPQQIFADALHGVSRQMAQVLTIPDRRQAIAQVIAQADGHDVVLIAGKGHETYQEINGQRFHFDDREQAEEALAQYVSHA